ncbi:reverse transcriptase [Cucumis melo var. makuwa]|uniref:Reverse transcriptase n=1 Tax=Cucumis melo var. makuwa TaxID=1194695 RepID=A0A5D3D8M8_CUCMM|nr:reverse transcriptase [Cucumis melo var. makuwa]
MKMTSPKDIYENSSIDEIEIVMDKEGNVDKNEVVGESTENETKQGHLGDVIHPRLENSDDIVPINKEKYQGLVGKLIYLWHNKSDISYAVSIVSQFMQTSYEDHMETVNKTLRALSLGIYEEIGLLKGLFDLRWDCEIPMKL